MKLLLIIYIALMLVFGVCDLDISLAIVNSDSVFAELFDRVGFFPMMILASFSLMLLAQKSHRYLFMTLGLLFDVIIVIAYSYFAEAFSPFILIFALILICFELHFAKILYAKYQEETIVMAKAIMIFMASAFVFTELAKTIWGRPRFRAMEDPSTEFKAWYILSPFGLVDEFRSFPSGHTTQAAMIIGLLFLNDLGFIKKRKSLYFLIVLWTTLVALSRVIAGAHFASDVLTGMMVSFSAYYVVKYHYFNPHITKIRSGKS